MTDNLSQHGIESDEPRKRGKKRQRGRKCFGVEYKIRDTRKANECSVLRQLRMLDRWMTHGWYTTAKQQSQAYVGLCKKSSALGMYGLIYDYRKVER